MLKGICYIAGAGEFCARSLHPGPRDLLIAADGGHQALKRAGLRPDLVIGDMDSSTQKVVGIPLLRYPVRKDDTDLSLAIRLGRRAGYKRFHLYGASGGPREDHFLAALQLIAGWSVKGVDIRLIAPSFTVYALSSSTLLIPTKPGQTISIFSHSEQSVGVSLSGLSYSNKNLTLSNRFPLGVSNAATSRRVLIRVEQGTLLIYQEQ